MMDTMDFGNVTVKSEVDSESESPEAELIRLATNNKRIGKNQYTSNECGEIIIKTEDEKLACRECNILLINETELKIHTMIHSDNHTCFVCNEFVKNRYQFVGHVRKHMSSKPFQCPNCERAFTSPREMKLHQRVHSDERPFMCTECGKAFKTLTTLNDHKVVHTGEKRFRCKICEGSFATCTSLRRHVRVMHETVRSFVCRFCDEGFSSKQALKQHILIHTDVNVDEQNKTEGDIKKAGYCEYCTNMTYYFDLKSHINKDHQPRECKICNLVFYDDKSLDNHNKSHSEVPMKEELVCGACGKQFEFPRYLKAHLKRHEEDYKKYKCDLCDKGFSSNRDLKDHLAVHANVKNFNCEVCGKAFRTKQCVKKHMPVHSDRRPYVCKVCNKSFKKQSILSKHYLTHSVLRPHACSSCGKRYKSKESLRVHLLSHKRKEYDSEKDEITDEHLEMEENEEA